MFSMIGLLHIPIAGQGMNTLTIVLNLIDTSLSLLHSFTATFLTKWRNETFLCEIQPNCGPFYLFGLHSDQVCNCGPLRKHCLFKAARDQVVRLVLDLAFRKAQHQNDALALRALRRTMIVIFASSSVKSKYAFYTLIDLVGF